MPTPFIVGMCNYDGSETSKDGAMAGKTWLDRVAVLEHGHVVEVGPPQELRRAGGPFARLLQAAERLDTTASPVAAPEPWCVDLVEREWA